MKSFEYSAPKKLEEAIGLLSDSWGKTEIMAGGTDLVTALKQQITVPERVVSLRNISELQRIRVENDTVHIGSMTTLADFAAHPAIQQHFPALITAVQEISSPQITSIGTVGGDLCQRPRCWYFRLGYGLLGKDGDRSLVPEGDNRYHAIFGNDGPAYFVSASSLGPALVALGASLTLAGPEGKNRELPAEKFFQIPKNDSDRETALKPGEILREIHVPIQGLRNALYEVRHRHGLDWPYVTAAVAFQHDNGQAQNPRVILGHVAPIPWNAKTAAEILKGARLDEPLAAKCGQAATEGAKPLSKNSYKIQLVKTAVKRAVLAAAA
jgi:xanthine dehydrogenase YagS FAD-binding subunit